MSDPCREMRGTLGAAALGRIDPAEEIALRAHLDGCAECRAELRELTAVARSLAAVPMSAIDETPAEPPGALVGRVLDQLARERDTQRSQRVHRLVVGAAAGSGLAAAVIAAVLVVGSGGGAGGTRIAMPGVGVERSASASATLRAKPAGTEVDVKVQGLHDGDYYWLWVTGESGRRIAAGTFRGSAAPMEMRLTAALPLSKARRIWVTDGEDRVVLDARVPVST